jgi:hypothetical protein
MKITDNDMEKAVLFLSSTDEEFARAKSFFHALERQTKTIKAMAFMRSGEKTDKGKENYSLCAPAYTSHLEKLHDAELTFLKLQEERNTSLTMIEVWRSLNSARSKGVL